MYLLTLLSGPLLGIAASSTYTLIPFHNALEDPCYWYEYQIVTIFICAPYLPSFTYPVWSVYWANFQFNRKWFSYILLLLLGCGTWAFAVAMYYFAYWFTDYSHPMPLNFISAGCVTCAVCNFCILLRYTKK